jgi:hypothetical protein
MIEAIEIARSVLISSSSASSSPMSANTLPLLGVTLLSALVMVWHFTPSMALKEGEEVKN